MSVTSRSVPVSHASCQCCYCAAANTCPKMGGKDHDQCSVYAPSMCFLCADELSAVCPACAPFPCPAGGRVNFTGETVFPWMFDDFAALRPFKEAAELLAKKQDWPMLYDPAQLADNKVPAVAATYLEDMYVDYELAQETAAGVAGLRQWVTNEYKHSGIRDDGSRIFDRLLAMARDALLVE